MALSLPATTVIVSQKPFNTSFLPPNPYHPTTATIRAKRRTTTTLIVASNNNKMVQYPPLDRHATTHNRHRFARKLKTLLLSKPRHFLPLRVLDRCRNYLGLPRPRRLLPMILRYPSLFRLFEAPSHTSPTLSLLSVTLTPAAAALSTQESLLRASLASSLAAKLHRLLMLASPHHRLLLSKLSHLAPDLGLPPNFRSRLCNAHLHRFRTVDTSYGRALELVSFDPALSSPFPAVPQPLDPSRKPIIDRPPKFKKLPLRKGLNLKRRHMDYLIRFHEMPEPSPYSPRPPPRPPGTAEEAEAVERRACAVVREVLAMTVEKRTLVDHLTHFRREMGLPNRLRAMMVRHPEMFYVSIKGQRDSVFLAEAYDGKGKLIVQDELMTLNQKLVELVNEGKRMRREWRKGGAIEDSDDEDDDESDVDDDDGFDGLFDPEIGDDWEDFDAAAIVGEDECYDGGVELAELWSSIEASTESIAAGGGGGRAW